MSDPKRTCLIHRPSEFDLRATENEQDLELLEPGWGKAALGLRTRVRPGHAPTAMRTDTLEDVHHRLEARKRRVESGDSMEVLCAIYVCAEENVPLPTWLAEAFRSRLMSVLSVNGNSPSLDAAFKSNDFPTGSATKAANARRNWELGHQLCRALWKEADRRPEVTSLDPLLVAVLSKRKWGVGKTTALRLVKLIDKEETELFGTQGLLRFLEIRRKHSSE